jgi:hypothetical protein
MTSPPAVGATPADLPLPLRERENGLDAAPNNDMLARPGAVLDAIWANLQEQQP